MYISKFRADTAYGVEDINEITKILTGSGVSPSTPNDVLSAIAEDGVIVSDEKCAVSFADAAKKTVRIGSGTVIMPDGSYIIISGGEVLEIPGNAEKAYVMIKHDEIEQNIPVCTIEKDTENDVLLATVSNGIVYDARHYAKSKIENCGSNSSTTVIYGFGGELRKLEAAYPGDSDLTRILPLLSDTRYNYVIITMPSYRRGAVVIKLPKGSEKASILPQSDYEIYFNASYYMVFSINEEGQLLLHPSVSSVLNQELHALYV